MAKSTKQQTSKRFFERREFLSGAATLAGAGAQVRIGMPSGILTVGAEVGQDSAGHWVAHSGAFYRTARRLFDGRIYVPR